MTENTAQKPGFHYHIATVDDAAGIWAVLEEAAPEVPFSLEDEPQQHRMTILVGECCDSKNSWVALNSDGLIVGVALARSYPRELAALELSYVAVSKGARNSGIFTALVATLKAKHAPIVASVLHDNQSGMVDLLVKKGFTKGDVGTTETKLRWDPPQSQ